MIDFHEQIQPNKKAFEQDPFGYSLLAWHKWGAAQTIAGFDVDISRPPTSDDLKSPVLWLSQAKALSQAAFTVLTADPRFEEMPMLVRGMCHSQYCAVGLMLVGYSLEICLKAMIIMRIGIDTYTKSEKSMKHHRLVQLADFIPELTDRDKAILELLTHFVSWAGRYPDPGSGRDAAAERIFGISERHEISARQLFEFADRVTRHVSVVADEL